VKWSEWQPWSTCNSECKQQRQRDCIQNDIVIHDKYCVTNDRPKYETRECHDTSCHDATTRLPSMATTSSATVRGSIDPNFIFDPQTSRHHNFDKNIFSFLIGIASGILVLVMFIVILGLIVRYKRRRRKTGKKQIINQS
jgi:hypothetical protein